MQEGATKVAGQPAAFRSLGVPTEPISSAKGAAGDRVQGPKVVLTCAQDPKRAKLAWSLYDFSNPNSAIKLKDLKGSKSAATKFGKSLSLSVTPLSAYLK